MDQMLVYHGTRTQRKAAKARMKLREQKRAEKHQARRLPDSQPRELQDSLATELGVQSGLRRRLIHWPSHAKRNQPT